MKLTVSHISKFYESKEILSDCSYTFEQGGTYVLMGQNGCGKSTFLRICALLESPDSGELLYSDGNNPIALNMGLRQRITLVLPGVGIFNTSVFNNAAYGLSIRGQHRADIEVKVMQVLRFVGLELKRNQHARTLSTGETQRLGIARALAIDPEILLLDEPTASVDEENTLAIEAIIKNLRENCTSTVIMTTHDSVQAERLTDKILLLRSGVVCDRSSVGG